jgi:hypothetical protein
VTRSDVTIRFEPDAASAVANPSGAKISAGTSAVSASQTSNSIQAFPPGAAIEARAVSASVPSTEGESFPRIAQYFIAGHSADPGETYGYDQTIANMAKRSMVVINTWPGYTDNGRDAGDIIGLIHNANPDCRVYQYTTNSAIQWDNAQTVYADYHAKLFNEDGPGGLEDWWGRDAAGSGTDPVGVKVWTSTSSRAVNYSEYVTPDASGWYWGEWKAWKDHQVFVSPYVSNQQLNGWFCDNYSKYSLVTMDLNNDGVNEDSQNAVVADYHREMHAKFVNNLRLNGLDEVIVNFTHWWQDTTLPSNYENSFDGGVMEHAMGAPLTGLNVTWSIEGSRDYGGPLQNVNTWGSWAKAMASYARFMQWSINDKRVVYQANMTPTNYRNLRYGLTSALMHNGWWCMDNINSFYKELWWYDEYDFDLGQPVDEPPIGTNPLSQPNDYQNGVFVREFDNGLAVCNPRGNGTRTITLPDAGPNKYWAMLEGTQDPSVNNGETVTTITLQDADGRIVRRMAATALFPRIALTWQGKQHDFSLDPRREHKIAAAELMVCNQFEGDNAAYRTAINNTYARNPKFKAIKYLNMEELEQSGWMADRFTALQLIDNPNRGGSDTANDGILRNAAGAYVGSGFGGSPATGGNIGINNTTFPSAYSGTPASGDSDISKPRTGEKPREYQSRADYYQRMVPKGLDFLKGGFFDVTLKYDFNKSPTYSDSDNNGSNSQITNNEWQGHKRHMIDLIFGETKTGLGDTAPKMSDGVTPGARADGQPWYINDSEPLVTANTGDWSSYGLSTYGQVEIPIYLNGGTEPPLTPDYVGMLHGGYYETAMGGVNGWGCGIAHDGTAQTVGSGNGSPDYCFALLETVEKHCIDYPPYGQKMSQLEGRYSNYWCASHSFILGSFSNHLQMLRDYNGFAGLYFCMFELDEQVGGDILSMSADQIAARKHYWGAAIDPPWPYVKKTDGTTIIDDGSSNSTLSSAPVWVREFENALILSIPGRTHYKNATLGIPQRYEMNEIVTVNMSLFPAGSGKKWQRFQGGQLPAWNNGQDVGATITLGTSAQNINQNSIVLLRVNA